MTTTTDYVGNIIYENGALKRILTSEGYYQGGHYHYYLKDHLGSIREVLRDDQRVEEQNHYYPSGMRFGESAVNGGSVQPYRHTGHEMQEMHGLNWIDNNARFRTVSDGGGFTGMDPLSEKKTWLSPYVYCSDNPVVRIDTDGKWDANTGGNPSKINKTTGVATTAQSSTYMLASKEKIKSTPYTAPVFTGEIKDADIERIKSTHNEIMNDPVAKQSLTDPVLKSAAVGLGVTGAVAAAPELIKGGAVAVQAIKGNSLSLGVKVAQVALENPNATQVVLGIGTGVAISSLTGEMQDVPQFTTGLPVVDNALQITQTAMTTVNFFSTIAPQTNALPANNASQVNNIENEKK